jgi:PAS domain S-box-containing protein
MKGARDMDANCSVTVQDILESVGDGVYATDTARKIIYWGKGAERITGWTADDMVGTHCFDGVLCHVDKDGHRLCGAEHCPLYRSIATGRDSTMPVLVFAVRRDGSHVPLQVNVSPIRNGAGAVVGGVETFRDLSAEFGELQRVRRIQTLVLQQDMPADPRIRLAAHYVARDFIGGDYYAVARLDADRYGFMVADVMGHGLPAAMYTLYLNSLWEEHRRLVVRPHEFAQTVDGHLRHLILEEEPFAAATCGVFDLERGELRVVGAGNPMPLLIRGSGSWERVPARGLPLGVMGDSAYEEHAVRVAPGDCVLFVTDGATEIRNPQGGYLGEEGLERILRQCGYPDGDISLAGIEEKLLRYSDRIRFDDDLTLLEARLI